MLIPGLVHYMKNLAPYQIFFPLGILSALSAIGVWLVQGLNWFSSPAILIHSKLIMGGFLWSFIIGFLMTAIPRMTGTESARKSEMSLAVLLILSQIFQAWIIDGRWFYGTGIVLILFLIFYAGRRILQSKKTVPVFFSHVGIAIALALAGAAYHFTGNSVMGLHLYHIGAVLLLVLGIGTRFFSFLSGLPSVFEETTSKRVRLLFHLMGLSVTGFLFAAGLGKAWAYLGLSIVTLFYLVFIWRIFRASDRPSALKYGVRVVALMIPVSFFLSWFRPSDYITWFHFLFIGCFTLLTFSVATRVTLAHGSYPVALEMKTRSLWVFLTFLLLGLFFRILYRFIGGDLQVHLLHLAACFWILAIVVWCASFLVKIFKPGNLAKPAC